MSDLEQIQLTINDQKISVNKGTTVYQAIKKLGVDVPIFCYHDQMPPFGACRVCLVEVEKMGKLQASCTLEAAEGMVVKTHSQNALEGRQGILELLLINHPLDCPVCDRGGECPLQEHTLHHGPGTSRFFEEKRHFKKPKALGPLLMLDRERCIICARCTRFGEHIAGDHALEMISRGFKTEVGTPNGEPVKSKFIGNTIMICPVGALTSEVYRFRARPWDNDVTASSCSLCSVGCSYYLDSRDGEIMRTRACENQDVNSIWLCDKGWFGYEHVYHPDRLKTPLIRLHGKLEPASWNEALGFVVSKIQQAKESGKAAGLGGNPLTLEENDLFQQLIRKGAGVNHLDHRIGMPIFSLNEEGLPSGMEISLGDCEKLAYVFIFGSDITEEFPVLWLRLKQAMNAGAKIFFCGHFAPEMSAQLSEVVLHPPGEEMKILKEQLPKISKLLQEGKPTAVFVGNQYLALNNRRDLLTEVVAIKKNQIISVNLLEGRNNSMGARLGGMRPEIDVDGKLLSAPGLNALQVLEKAAEGGWDLLYVAGADPVKKFPSKLWRAARSKLGCLVVQDLFLTATAAEADLVLPTLGAPEKTGTFINIAGKAQRLNPAKEIPQGIYSDAEIFFRLARMLNISLENANFVGEGFMKGFYNGLGNPQQSIKESDGLRATLAHALFDEGNRMQHNPHLTENILEQRLRLHPHEAKERQLNEGDSVTISTEKGSITAKISLDNRVAKGVIVLPLGFGDIPVQELEMHYKNGMKVTISKV